MNVIAIDPGPTTTGVYLFKQGKEQSLSILRQGGHYEYMVKLRGAVITLCYAPARDDSGVVTTDMAIVEDYPYGMPGDRAAHAIEVGAVVREALTSVGVPIVAIPISTWKSITIGVKRVKRGSARIVREYLEAVQALYGRVFVTTDEADAFMMYEAALAIWRGETRTAAAVRIRDRMEAIAAKVKARSA